MSYIWVGFDRKISPQLIIEVLKNKFRVSNVYELQTEIDFKRINEDTKKVFYEIRENNSEFPVIWDFFFLF